MEKLTNTTYKGVLGRNMASLRERLGCHPSRPQATILQRSPCTKSARLGTMTDFTVLDGQIVLDKVEAPNLVCFWVYPFNDYPGYRYKSNQYSRKSQ
jgi:hypothetical protein